MATEAAPSSALKSSPPLPEPATKFARQKVWRGVALSREWLFQAERMPELSRAVLVEKLAFRHYKFVE